MTQGPNTPGGIADRDRLAALDGYRILDTPPEPGFDGIVVLACAICAAPAALVSLVTEGRQWFKARSGFPDYGTVLDASVYKHVIGRRDLLVIPNLSSDARLSPNPLVTNDPHLRFYAGAPLLTPDGLGLGSLCVIDTEPHPLGLSEEQRECLQVLAGLVMAQLDLHRALAAARRP